MENVHQQVYLYGQLAGEVAANETGEVSTEEKEEESKRHGLFHLAIAVGLVNLTVTQKKRRKKPGLLYKGHAGMFSILCRVRVMVRVTKSFF